MLIVDTGPLVAMLSAKDKHREARTALRRRFRGAVIVPAPIVAKVAYFLQVAPRPAAEAASPDVPCKSGIAETWTNHSGPLDMAGT
jgi:predicted nucleic acid-binding protein